MNADREYLAAGLALGGLSHEELDAALALESSDAEFRAEVSSFRETMSLVAESDVPVAPTQETEAAILAIPQTASVRDTAAAGESAPQDAQQTSSPQPTSRQHRSRLTTTALALAASVLLVVAAILGGAAVVQYNERSELEDSLYAIEAEREEVQQLLVAPDLAATHAESAVGGSVTVSYSISEQILYVTPHDMPAPDAGEALQMWIIDDHGAHDAGLMAADSAHLVTEMTFAEDVAFGITVEPEGGSEEPTSDPILVTEL